MRAAIRQFTQKAKDKVQETYGMGEDWKETGRAIRDRAGEVAKETIKAGSDSLKTFKNALSQSQSPREELSREDPAKSVPPESVNGYDVKKNIGDITQKVSNSAKKIKERFRQAYEKVESMNKVEGSSEAPADGPVPEVKPEDLGIGERETKEAFNKGRTLMREREKINE
jgi:hypothetical protein